MKKVELNQEESLLKSKKLHRNLRRAVALLSVVVLLFTINTLKKRANTLERIPMCGMEEHLHDGTCFNELGELICLLPEHQHTDACFQQSPVYEEQPEEFAEEMEVDLPLEDEPEAEPETEPEVDPQEALPAEEPAFPLSQSALLSDIIRAMDLPVALGDVVEVGQVVNTETDFGLVSVERLEDGDARVSANAAFDEAELAIVTDADILTVKLVGGVAAAEPVAEEPVAEEPVAEETVAEETVVGETAAVEADGNTPEIPEETVEEADGMTGEGAGDSAPATEEQTEVGDAEGENAEEQTEVGDAEAENQADGIVPEIVEVQLGGEEDATEPAETVADTEAEPEIPETVETVEAGSETETDETEPEENIVETVAAEPEIEAQSEAETDETEPEENIVETVSAEPEIEAQPEAETDETETEPAETEAKSAETEPEENIVETVAVEPEIEAQPEAEANETETEPAETEAEPAETEAEPAETESEDTETESAETEPAETEAENEEETSEDETKAETEEDETEAETEEDETKAETEEDETKAETEEDETKAETEEEETEAETEEDETEAETEGEETEEATETEEEAPAVPETVEQSASASISVDLSSVDLMQAATVEGDTVTLAVSDLLNAEDDAVNLEGDLHVEAEEFAAAATVTDSDVEVQDGVITLTAEALESGTVSLELQTETTEDDVTTVTTQTVDITLTGYTGRTSDAIAGDEGVAIVPLGDNTLPNDAYATLSEVDEVPEAVEIAPATETTAEAARAFDITVINDNQDEISETGEVEVTVTPENLNVYSEVPEGAAADPESLKLELFHVHDDGTMEPVPDASFETDDEGNVTRFTFTTESFSTYVVKYTVDFAYVDADGNEHFWSFPGTGSYPLMEVLSELGIEGETITDASLDLVEEVEEAFLNALYLTQDEETQEYFINSDVAFDDTYELTVTLDNTVYTIIVTDAVEENQTWTVNVNLYDYDETKAAPDAALNSIHETTYGIMAVVYDKYEGTPLGYKVIGTNFRVYSNNDNNHPTGYNSTAQVTLDLNQCNKLVQNSSGAWVDANSPDKLRFDSAKHDVQFEIFEGTDSTSSTHQTSTSDWAGKKYEQMYSYPRSVSGFDFRAWPNGHVVHMDTKTAELNLRRSYTKTYNLCVRIPPDENSIGIPADQYLYAYVRLNAGMENEKTGKVQIICPPNTGDTVAEYTFPVTEWRATKIGTSEKKNIENLTFTGNETADIGLYYKPGGNGNQRCDDFDSIYDKIGSIATQHEIHQYVDGDTVNNMKVSLTPIREIVNGDSSHPTQIKDIITFFAPDPTGTITKSYIDSFLEDARDFGYYTERYDTKGGDIEATIGAAVLAAKFSDGFGYSERNVKVNTLKVKKVYLKESGSPADNMPVTINLKKNGNIIKSESGTTNSKGILEVEFTGLEAGTYGVSETIGNKEIDPGTTAQVSGVTANFSASQAQFMAKGNINYFGSLVDGYTDAEILTMLEKGNRVPMVILTDTQELANRINTVNTTDNGNRYNAHAYMKGTDPYKTYDIMSDMVKLRELSMKLANEKDSPTVRVINIRASQLTEEGLSFVNENRFIVVNVLMDQETFCPMVRMDGNILEGDFGKGGKENSTKVLFNLLDADGVHCYGYNASTPPEFNTSKTGAGVILAPSASSHMLGGVFGGTIISKWVKREGNELHSDSPNERQTLSITIQNEIGQPKVGMLELRKKFVDPKINDKITWFTFKVTLTDTANPSKVKGKSFPASGLRKGDSVKFNDAGVAYVQVRADNSVTIANLPEGTTYAVEETDAQQYVFDHSEGATGIIVKGQTATATMFNDVERTGLTLKKVVEGTTATDKPFTFNLYLWEEDASNNKTAYIGTVGGMTFTALNYDGHPAGVSDNFTLVNGGEKTIDGLPKGIHYAFVEKNTNSLPAGYKVKQIDSVNQDKVEGVVGGSGNTATITNVYEAKGSAQFYAKKAANAKLGNSTFTFELYDAEDKKLQTSAEVRQGEMAAFTAINYTEADDDQTYTYTIRETIPEGAVRIGNTDFYMWDGVKYDGHTQTVEVHVADNGDGTLAITYNGKPTFATPEFVNDYTVEGTQYAPKVTKQLKQGEVIADDNLWPANGFTFDLAAAEDNPEGATLGKAVANATWLLKYVSFGDIRFAYVEGLTYPATYRFTITERDESADNPGFTYNTDPVTVEVTVDRETDESQNHKLVVTGVKYGNNDTVMDKPAIGTTSVTVVNTYDSVKAQPKAYKNLDGVEYAGTLTDDEGNPVVFTFQLTPVSVNGVPVEDPVSVWASTSGTGNVAEFAPFEYKYTKAFDADDYSEVYVYKITEVDESVKHPNITYDTTEWYWKVVVTKDEETGKLSCTDSYFKGVNTDSIQYKYALFKNKELTDFHFIKVWTNGVNITDAIAWPKNTAITVTLRRKLQDSEPDEGFSLVCRAASDQDGAVSIVADGTIGAWTKTSEEDNNYRFEISGLEKYDASRNEWIYYAEETDVPAGFHVKYGENYSGEYAWEQNGNLIYNHMNTVALPATGGAGTNALYALGGGLVLLAVLGWVLGARKRRDDEA